MKWLDPVKKILADVIELFIQLVAVGVLAGILFGAQVQFFNTVLQNLLDVIGSLGERGLVGLIALAVLLYVFNRK